MSIPATQSINTQYVNNNGSSGGSLTNTLLLGTASAGIGALTAHIKGVNADDMFIASDKLAKKDLQTILSYKNTIMKDGFDKLDTVAKEALAKFNITDEDSWKKTINKLVQEINIKDKISKIEQAKLIFQSELQGEKLNKAIKKLDAKKTTLDKFYNSTKASFDDAIKNTNNLDEGMQKIFTAAKNSKMIKYGAWGVGIALAVGLLGKLFSGGNKSQQV